MGGGFQALTMCFNTERVKAVMLIRPHDNNDSNNDNYYNYYCCVTLAPYLEPVNPRSNISRSTPSVPINRNNR